MEKYYHAKAEFSVDGANFSLVTQDLTRYSVMRLRKVMQKHQDNEPKVKVATREAVSPRLDAINIGLLLLVIVSVLVLVGRYAGGM